MNTSSAIESALAPAEQQVESLGDESYTFHRLKHATPEHLHLTTRRCFIGPIPEGWLKSHRREWYKHHLHIHYSSRSPTFTAGGNQGRQRRLTGLDGPSVLATRGLISFPQPSDAGDDAVEDDNDEREGLQKANAPRINIEPEEGQNEAPVTLEDPPAVPVARARAEELTGVEAHQTLSPETELRTVPSTSSTFSTSSDKDGRFRRRHPSRPQTDRTTSNSSFYTANESLAPSIKSKRLDTVDEAESPVLSSTQTNPSRLSSNPAPSLAASDHGASSMASLIQHESTDPEDPNRPSSPKKSLMSKIRSNIKSSENVKKSSPPSQVEGNDASEQTATLVRFNLPEDEAERHMKLRLAQLRQRKTFKRIHKSSVKDGEVVKMENMLVRVEFTAHEIPNDFNENASAKIESRPVEKWKEYMVVCRETSDEDTPFTLQMYKSRVIPTIDHKGAKRFAHHIPLNKSTTRTNLYSSLDKTICLWVPKKNGHLIYIMQARAGASSMEWYTFLRSILGWRRTSVMEIKVPDLDLVLQLDKPFEDIEISTMQSQSSDAPEDAVMLTMKKERAIAGKIVQRCLQMLLRSPDLAPVIEAWAAGERIGLAWKRYDRLEWVHGANEKKMYGTIGMEKSHELELRTKHHYPTLVQTRKETLTEPPPVEGFLIRLTSQKGQDRRFGRLLFKRLYFSSHNQYLSFNRPARADPPPPPKLPMQTDERIPTAEQIAEKIPLIYSINPFPLQDGKVKWLLDDDQNDGMITIEQHDRDAFDEDERKTNLLLRCDGVINMCNIAKVRNVKQGAVLSDENIEEGSDVDFDMEVPDTRQDDGATSEFDDQRAFELVMRNGLIIRLQAYDKVTRREWMKRLRQLSRYWRIRTATDILQYKAVRRQNLERLKIDEATEAYVGQHSEKWQVANSVASPELYHMCGISCCRTVHLSGVLFRKTRMHSDFEKYLCLLSHGNLLMFQDSVRSKSGKLLSHIHHERVAALDLRECYVYSGVLVDNDLLYTSQKFDSARAGHYALPRLYADDGWSSIDEDNMTCFVVWHGRRKTLFRKEVDGKDYKTQESSRRKRVVKRVSSLGVQGRSIVFKTRSRAERDHWVMSIGLEIERLNAGNSDVRLTN